VEFLAGKPILPVCMLAHEMVNKLSVIIGNCDLVSENTPPDSDCAKRLRIIGEAARYMVTELNKHQCELSGLLRTARLENENAVETKQPQYWPQLHR
jgi:nitrogen-specific signal transduction histidine kinase